MTLVPDFRTLVDAVQHHVVTQPEKIVFEFSYDDGRRDYLSFRALDRKARSVAATLKMHSSPGDRVVIPTNNRLDLHVSFLACMYANRVAVPVVAPRARQDKPEFGLGRLLRVLEDCKPTVALWNEADLKAIADFIPLIETLSAVNHIPVIAAALEEPLDADEISVEPNDVAFLQYSSGSTSAPKGVMLTHHCIVHNQALAQSRGHMPADGGVVSWLPLYHDMGLCKGFFFPLYKGVACTVMSPADFVANPERWLLEISRRKEPVILSGGPNFAYALCMMKIKENILKDLDLSRWKLAFNGAEPIDAGTLVMFTMRFSQSGFRFNYFYPAYGLAEATLFVSGGEATDEPIISYFCKDAIGDHHVKEVAATEKNLQLVSVGRACNGASVEIVNPETFEILPEGQVGELWVNSESCGLGYWGKPVESAEVFNRALENRDGLNFVRTGDLGFVHKGKLYISGRIKEMIIINGVNYYPFDIEWVITRNISGCSIAAAITKDEADSAQLAVIVEVGKTILNGNTNTIARRIQQLIYDEFKLGVQDVFFVERGQIPRTTSGKIQRTLCKAKIAAGEFEYKARWMQEESLSAA